MLRILRWIGLAFLVLLAVIAFNTIRFTPPASTAIATDVPKNDGRIISEKLARAIQFKTISHPQNTPGRSLDFERFMDWIGTAFPNALGAMDRDIINGFTPIYKWAGSDPAAGAVLISGHYDVVPIEGEWSRDPWAGEISEGFVWGRGALDMKGGLMSVLEAADLLAAQGFQPKSDVYFALTHDEEIGGDFGSQGVVDYLRDNNIAIDWSLDEGSFVLRDIISSIDADIASINIAEKGYMTVRITAHDEGGHSSLPQRQTAVTKLAEVLVALQNEPVAGGLTGVTRDFFDRLGRHMGLAERVLFANAWLFKPVIEGVLSGANTTDAMLRSSTAPTMLEASDTENVLSQAASAVVNFRLHPRDTPDDILAHIQDQIESDDISVEVLRATPASPVSDHENRAFTRLAEASQAVFGDVAIVPGLTIGGTDSAKYSQYVGDSYRFLPFVFTSDDLALMHGKDERVSIENLARAVEFYQLVLGDL
ncbi:MAG: M20/M25/M40 family metallo-hydrolase [Pseudomonadota bacterium]